MNEVNVLRESADPAIRLVAAATRGLGACFYRGTGKGPFVELGYGRLIGPSGDPEFLYLNARDAAHVATAIGWVDEEQAQTLRDEAAALRAENEQLRAALADADVTAEKVQAALAWADGIRTSYEAAARLQELEAEGSSGARP